MTLRERAEKIIQYMNEEEGYTPFIESEIKAAVDERENSIMTDKDKISYWEEKYQNATNEALEKAAQVAKGLFFQALGKNEEAEKWLANEIRKLKGAA